MLLQFRPAEVAMIGSTTLPLFASGAGIILETHQYST